MVHKKADDMPKKDFIKRYGKDGDSCYGMQLQQIMTKKKLGIEDMEDMEEAFTKKDFHKTMKMRTNDG